MSAVQMIRVFIAVELPDAARRALTDLQARLKRERLAVRWVRPAGIHLTLKFLGDVPAEQVDAIGQATATAIREHRPLRLGIQGLGVFPGVRKARVIWAGLTGETAALLDLKEAVETAMETVGFPRDRRRFKAHLTLGRFKKTPPAPELVALLERCAVYDPCDLPLSRVVVYRSELRPQGARYTPLFTVSLDADSKRTVSPI
ncbi:MAG: RNA 2',3'-cyclic phosphodiesterase [Desulfosarcinaceae bacterium]|jgi:2'-5' RNA ligase